MPAPSGIRDTRWADGLRGLASVLVVTAHIARWMAPFLLAPALDEKLPPVFLQLPVIRNFFMGRASVAIFAVLSGYVNALKPIRQTRNGQVEAALSGVAKSAFRRTGRFVLPALVATTFSWLVCQLGAYNLARVVSADWIRATSPEPSASCGGAVGDLLVAVGRTWVDGANQYDRIQWTLCYLLRGSMLVYLTLFATAYVRPRFRYVVYAILYCYYYWMGDCVVGTNVYLGMAMAELQQDPDVQAYVESGPVALTLSSSSLISLGLICISYPEEHPEWARWSNGMSILADAIFPRGSEFSRYWPGIGAEMICLGVMFSPTAKRILSRPWPCWLGEMSFAIYLLHAPLIRTLLTWMLFGAASRPPSAGLDDEGYELAPGWVAIPNRWLPFVCIPLFYVILYRLAGLWCSYVEPWCGKVTNRIEEKVFTSEGVTSEKLFA